MKCYRKVTENLYWIGANDHRLDRFENIHPVPEGISYNSYLLLDEKTVLFDTVDWSVCRQFLENLTALLDGRNLDYLVINHMEPDHGASLQEVLIRFPEVTIISTEKAFMLMNQFGFQPGEKQIVVQDGDRHQLGNHEMSFLKAPMVHWPEVMATYDETSGVLFTADAFGTFGALDGRLFADEMDFERNWLDEARRYYANIVGKYGPHVQALLRKTRELEFKYICPLHGPVIRKEFQRFIGKYDQWSRYEPEEKGVLIVYASMYGNTEAAACLLASKLAERGMTNLTVRDVSSTHVSWLISDVFKYSNLVLASVTYNLGIYPLMHNFLMDMKALNLQKRTVGILENGSWACKSGGLMREILDQEMKEMTVLGEQVTMASSLNEGNLTDLDALTERILESMGM